MERVFLIRDFVRESNRIEGIGREPTEQEVNAHRDFLKLQFIRVEDLENLVSVLQPGAKLREEAGMDVRVGDYVAPRGGPEIVERLSSLLRSMQSQGAYDTHLAYEHLHPFTDGNGRSGRALWLWQMGGDAPLGFLHRFYYQTLRAWQME